MAFDGIVTKAIASELQLLKGARIDKIFQPNSNTVIIGMYLNGSNYALNICINPSNYRINLTTHQKSNPKVAPNFCMVLRKHLIGLRLKNVITNSLERIITIELEGFDDVDDIISSKIIVELMGKHCNIILLNDEGIIIDCLRHINNESSTHIVVPHIKYLYPEINKKNFLDISNFQEFNSIIDTSNPLEFSNKISQTFNGISKKYIDFIIEKLAITNLHDIYNYLQDVINKIDADKLDFNIFNNKPIVREVYKDHYNREFKDSKGKRIILNCSNCVAFSEKMLEEQFNVFKRIGIRNMSNRITKMENNIKSIEKRLEELVKSKDELLEKFFYEEERLNELFKL